MTNEEIDIIKKEVEKNGNVSIFLGRISLGIYEKLTRHFKVTREPFGYYHFENK